MEGSTTAKFPYVLVIASALVVGAGILTFFLLRDRKRKREEEEEQKEKDAAAAAAAATQQSTNTPRPVKNPLSLGAIFGIGGAVLNGISGFLGGKKIQDEGSESEATTEGTIEIPEFGRVFMN
jgi:flagellar biosynthesis/type III secretory pathway M-ring protein FliF/YscJ